MTNDRYNQFLIRAFVTKGSVDLPGTLLDYDGESNDEEGGGSAGCYVGTVHFWWKAVKVAAEPIFTLNDTLIRECSCPVLSFLSLSLSPPSPKVGFSPFPIMW